MTTLEAAGPLTVNGLVAPARALALGFDVDSRLSLSQARALKAQYGYEFCVRFVGRGRPSANDLTASEAADILAAGLALFVVQHWYGKAWLPTAALGAKDGCAAAENALGAGLPAGVSVFCDLEGVDETAAAADVWAYCNGWCGAVQRAGYVPGIYVGADCGLDAVGLTELDCRLFWRSCSKVPTPAQGYQMTQTPCDVVRGANGTQVDENRVSATPGTLAWVVGERL